MQALVNALTQQAPAPRLPVHRHARRRQDHGLAHPGQVAQLHRARTATAASPPQPCGVCEACSDIDAGRFVDYIELDAASNRGVDEISAAARAGGLQAGAGPLQGLHDRRSAHAHGTRLQRDAEDAGRAARVPQVRAGDDRSAEGAGHGAVALPAVQPAADGAGDDRRSTWRACCAAEGVAADAAALRLLARAARGSMRDALSLTDQAIAFGGGALEEAAGARRCSARRSRPCGPPDRGAGGARRRDAVAAVDGLRALGLSAARHARGDGRAAAARWRCCRPCRGADDGDDPDAAVARAWRRCCRPTRRSCSTASSCTAATSWRWRRTNTRPGHGAAAPAGLRAGRCAAATERAAAGPGAAPTRRPAPRASPAAGAGVAARDSPCAARRRQPPGAGAARRRAAAGDAASTPVAAASAASSRSGQRPPRREREPRRATPPSAERWVDDGARDLIEAGSIAALVRELAMQAEGVAVDERAARRTGGCASSARRCARRRCARSCRRRWPRRGARRCGSSSRPASAVDTPAGAPPRRAASARREAEQVIHDDPLRPGADGAVQDRAHRARLGQAVVKFRGDEP